ncbi:MAG: CooT family nickel-binding protein [Methanotrichaceae archaeon]|nr:CooT family nickel-binding protein [Methanotrichaceae archaeon]
MCELTVYAVQNGRREKVMDGVVRLYVLEGKVRAEGIFGDSKEIAGRLTDVDIIGQEANVVA